MPQSKRLEKKLFKRRICRSLAMYSGIHQNPRDIRLYFENGKFSRTYGLDIPRQRPPLKACPVCGKKSRRGFFKSCADCAWVLEYREALDGLLERIEERLRVQGAGLDRFYHGTSVNIRVFLRCKASVADAMEPEAETGHVLEFSAGRVFSLHELRRANFTPKMFLDEILGLYEAAKKQADIGVDEKGRAITLARACAARARRLENPLAQLCYNMAQRKPTRARSGAQGGANAG